jgi:hypothetical protein
MIDFWEMVGRMVTNQAFLKDLIGFKRVQYPVGGNQRALIPADRSTIGGAQLNDDYELMRTVVTNYMPGKPLSLIGLGTMLWALTIPSFRTKGQIAAAKIAQAQLPAPVNDSFYVALGVIIVDDNMRIELIDNGNWAGWGFSSVDPADRASLAKILDVNDNPDTVSSVHNFCLTGWPVDCDARMFEWVGHTHPVTQ